MNQTIGNTYLHGNLTYTPDYLALAQMSLSPIVKIINVKQISDNDGYIKDDNSNNCITKSLLEMGFISDLKYVKINNMWVLIVCSNNCIFSFYENGDNMTKYEMGDYVNNTEFTTIYTGIAAKNNYLYIGSDTGNITIFELKNGCSLNSDNITTKLNLVNLPSPITCLEIEGVSIFCSTDSGSLLNVNCQTKITVSKNISPLALNKAMITVLKKLDDKYILGGLTSGTIFIYDISKDTLVHSVTNHTKEVTCIDGIIDKDGVNYLIGSGSDDGVITLVKWNPESLSITNEFSRNQAEKAIIGLHLKESTMYVTFYNASSVFIVNF